MILPDNIVTLISNVLRYDLTSYLNNYTSFIDNDRINILDYYSGVVDKPNQKSFNLLAQLLSETNQINSLLEIHSDRMNSFQYWEFLEVYASVEESLLTIDNSSKWLRSAITKNNFSPQVEIDTALKQMQTLEQLSRKLGSNNPDNDWIKMALRNDLTEEQYTSEGGNVITSSYSNKLSIDIRSVVDNVNGERIYGIDIDRALSFEDDDLSALSYQQTIKQTVDILSSLRAGQTPEFPLDGIQINLVAGSNRASIAYPVLFRQFYATFRKDDTLRSLAIKRIDNNEDGIFIDFEVQTRYGEVVPTQTIL